MKYAFMHYGVMEIISKKVDSVCTFDSFRHSEKMHGYKMST